MYGHTDFMRVPSANVWPEPNIGMFCCHQIWKTNLMTITNDIYPVASVGSVSGIVSLGSGLGGILFMNLTGRMAEALSYTSIFIIMGFLHPAAYAICRLTVPPAPAARVAA